MNTGLATRGLVGLAATAALVTALGAATRAQQQFPDGTGKEETLRICSTCHPAERGASVRLTREGWQDVLAKMVSLGAKGTDAELEAVLGYLATHFKGDAPKPINMNSATAIELESVAGLLRKEAAAWIDHRAKQGPCKALEDLKKVKALDFKKIDQRRDRLVCF